MYCVYILYSPKLHCYYTGTSDDFEMRLGEHNSGKYAGSFTKKGIPWEMFLLIDGLESKQAYGIEQHIKKMKSKKHIENLRKYPEMIEKLKTDYKH